MKSLTRVCLVVPFIWILSACSVSKDYPDVWPRLAEHSNTCQSFNGRYDLSEHYQHGASFSGRSDLTVEIAGWLFGEKREVDSISVNYVSPTSLTLTGFDRDGVMVTKRSVSNTDCNGNKLSFKAENTINDGGVSGYEDLTLNFSLTTNRDLVLESDSDFIGLVFLVPAMVNEKRWFMFDRLGDLNSL